MESLSPTKVLIWAKTYPELSSKYRETVCTGGCLEDGTPIRLYPVPLRYLPAAKQYRLYSWVSVLLRRNPEDARPESFRLARGQLPEVLHCVGTENGWQARREIVFKRKDWHFRCARHLHAARMEKGTSLGVVPVRQVDEIGILERPDQERRTHEEKLRSWRARLSLFADDVGLQRHLAFLPWRFRVRWRCVEPECDGHSASVLDWGLNELARRDGPETARAKLEHLADPSEYELCLFLGNLKSRPHIFSIVGLWYPRRADQMQVDLFTP